MYEAGEAAWAHIFYLVVVVRLAEPMRVTPGDVPTARVSSTQSFIVNP